MLRLQLTADILIHNIKKENCNLRRTLLVIPVCSKQQNIRHKLLLNLFLVLHKNRQAMGNLLRFRVSQLGVFHKP